MNFLLCYPVVLIPSLLAPVSPSKELDFFLGGLQLQQIKDDSEDDHMGTRMTGVTNQGVMFPSLLLSVVTASGGDTEVAPVHLCIQGG